MASFVPSFRAFIHALSFGIIPFEAIPREIRFSAAFMSIFSMVLSSSSGFSKTPFVSVSMIKTSGFNAADKAPATSSALTFKMRSFSE